ncbi:MAG TPA: flagellin [Candidatus Sulfotelmatobacter sp.]|nr:flagellin [Candidatus Sulfotelmatobacter sp.]
MPIGILNNISSLAAENQLTITNNSLQNVLFQLSSGSRINSGADDAAGLAIANGLEANVSALTQSASNANNGIGALQVGDGSLAQVTTLLNRAVTLATESATGTVGNQQRVALDDEYQSIQAEINRIGSNTNYNGTQVFTNNPTSIYISDGTGNTSQASNFISVTTGTLSASQLLGAGAGATLAANGAVTAGDNVTIGGTTYTFESAAALAAAPTGATAGAVAVAIDGNANPVTALQNTLANLAAAVNGGTGAGTAYQANVAGPNPNADATASAQGDTITFAATATGQALGGANIVSTVGQGAEFGFLQTGGTTFTTGTTSDLLTATDAQTALASIGTAIQSIAALRGSIGASINRLQSASNVINNQVQNLTSAENTITAADIPTAVAQLTKFTILEQTGISALAQANQQQQLVLKLLQ